MTDGADREDGADVVRTLTYTEASRELDDIVAFFEQREVDVDQLVIRLERATAIVDELDRRLRRTRAQVEELVPKLQAAAAPERDRAALSEQLIEIEVDEEMPVVDDPANELPADARPGAPELF